MKRLSSPYTFLNKRVFPVLWFVFLGGFLVHVAVSGRGRERPMLFVIPTVMAAFGFVTTRKLVGDLADEVYDCGDFLLFKRGGEEERIALSDVMNVSITTLVNPPRITLRLAAPCRFGDEIAFSPIVGLRLNPFGRIEIGEDLIHRVDRARSQRRS
ncbi:MAG TPA: hypothetical protein VEC57_06095 [Candidatus Limnocylindrales bacterium]|nr:hypothetical protein [Candidatus Limnocylindrales bacterium]